MKGGKSFGELKVQASAHVANVIMRNRGHMKGAARGFKDAVNALHSCLKQQEKSAKAYVEAKKDAREAFESAKREIEEYSEKAGKNVDRGSEAVDAATL